MYERKNRLGAIMIGKLIKMFLAGAEAKATAEIDPYSRGLYTLCGWLRGKTNRPRPRRKA